MNSYLDHFLRVLAPFLAGAIALVFVIASCYALNAIASILRRRRVRKIGAITLKPMAEMPHKAAIAYDIHLGKGRILHRLSPLGIVSTDGLPEPAGLPNGLLAYRTAAGYWVLVNPQSIQAIVPLEETTLS